MNNTVTFFFPRADGFHVREVALLCSLQLTFPHLLHCWDFVRKKPSSKRSGDVKNPVCLQRMPVR